MVARRGPAELVCHAYLLSRTVLRSEVVSWTADVLERLAPDDPVRPGCSARLAGGMSWVGRLEDAVRLGEETGSAAGSAVALQALEGLADAATYQGFFPTMPSSPAPRGGGAGVATRRRLLRRLRPPRHFGARLWRRSRGRARRRRRCAAQSRTVHARLVRVRLRDDARPGSRGRSRTPGSCRRDRIEVGDRFVTEVALLSSSAAGATGDLAAAVDRFSELLEHFGAGGDPGHLVTSLRNLVTPAGAPGSVPAGGCARTAPSPTTPSSPTYGEEAQRLIAALGRGVP